MILTNALTILDVAQEQFESAQEKYQAAKSRYTDEIDRLAAEMKEDPDVITAKQELDDLAKLRDDAEHTAETRAIYEWQSIQGRPKTWSQDNYLIRIRETREPIVTDYDEFLSDLKQMDATESVVKSVKVTLHKAKTLALHDLVGIGIDGLEIREKTTCTVRRE